MKFVDFLKEAVALKTENNDHDILDTNLKDVSASIFTYHAKKLNDILKDFYKQVEKYIKQRYDDSKIDVSKTFFDKDKNEFLAVVKALGALSEGPILRKNTHLTPLNHFEAILVGAAEVLRAGQALAPKKGWINDKELTKFSSGGTNTKSMLNGRIQRSMELFLGAKVSL